MNVPMLCFKEWLISCCIRGRLYLLRAMWSDVHFRRLPGRAPQAVSRPASVPAARGAAQRTYGHTGPGYVQGRQEDLLLQSLCVHDASRRSHDATLAQSHGRSPFHLHLLR